MLLADLVLSDLPLEVLVNLKHAINDEILRRKKQSFVAKRMQYLDKISFRKLPHTIEYEQAIKMLVAFNRKHILALPTQAKRADFRDRVRYLPCLLIQDWSRLFINSDDNTPSFYVYAHVDPREAMTDLAALQTILKGSPFYIGKGSGKRAWDLKRNQGHAKRIAHIRQANFPDASMVHIIADNLTEQGALILEAKLIYLFGSIYDETIHGCLVNLADHIKPPFVTTMPKLPKRKVWVRHQEQAAKRQAKTPVPPVQPLLL